VLFQVPRKKIRLDGFIGKEPMGKNGMLPMAEHGFAPLGPTSSSAEVLDLSPFTVRQTKNPA